MGDAAVTCSRQYSIISAPQRKVSMNGPHGHHNYYKKEHFDSFEGTGSHWTCEIIKELILEIILFAVMNFIYRMNDPILPFEKWPATQVTNNVVIFIFILYPPFNVCRFFQQILAMILTCCLIKAVDSEGE